MPSNTHDLIVIGGGPAGSSAAAIAARHGLRVLLLEAASHPRTHVGESLLPGVIPILERMGALADVEAAGFTRKTGSTHWGWGRTPKWDLWFSNSELFDHAWLVDRARFDEILFHAAARAGAEARQHATATGFLRDGARVVGVSYRVRGEEAICEARAPFTIDASGQGLLMARELGLRSNIPGLKHEASWAHFEGARHLPPPRQGQALFVATAGEWMWLFPLGGGRASVGLVRLEEGASGSERDFDDAIRRNKELLEVLGPEARRAGPVRNVRDWSYRVGKVAGPGFFLAGDASGFVDPVLSTGVHLAMHSGFHAADLVSQVLSGKCGEADAIDAYSKQHAELFGDMLRIVRFFYQQNLHREDYFWESKQMLVDMAPELQPQRAFMILTSGLMRNLSLDERRASDDARRWAAIEREPQTLDSHDPDRLGFVCFHLHYAHEGGNVPLYFLIEPQDPAAPSLFRTANFNLNCLAPHFGNDPINVPALAPHLRGIERAVRELDTLPGESLVDFWRRSRGALVEAFRALPGESFELLRVFGE